ncbi:MAG: hypothetical protein WAN64_13220, partial [Pseudolabrys sp.]
FVQVHGKCEAAANFLVSMSVGIAMDTIILLPGGGGSRLTLQNQEVWPPTLLELAVGYNRTTDLRSSNVKVGTILDTIPKLFPCYDVYRPLQDDLAKIAKSCGAQFVNFPYDWRKDVISSTEKLAAKIKSSLRAAATRSIWCVTQWAICLPESFWRAVTIPAKAGSATTKDTWEFAALTMACL